MPRAFSYVYSDEIDGPFVMFVTGMRVRRIGALGRWAKLARAMEPMVRELQENSPTGFLHAEGGITLGGVEVVQYWKSFEHLYSYVYGRGTMNLPAWAEFNQCTGDDGAVAMWHETCQIADDAYPGVYEDLTSWGDTAVGLYEASLGRLRAARRRWA
jgi:Domain of unknown function (DUF4188)